MTAICNARKKSDQTSEAGCQCPVFQPAVDIRETDSGVDLFVEMPGVDDSNVDVTLENNRLTIHGSVEAPSFDGLAAVRTEYQVGNYERSFAISEEIDQSSIDATVRNGLLTIHLQRRKEAGPQKVNVKAI
jgi:HSP20 family protein